MKVNTVFRHEMWLCGLLSLLLFVPWMVQAQNIDDEHAHHDEDSSSVESPLFMPVYYDFIEPHFYKPLKSNPEDTAVTKVHQYDAVWKDENIYQTLGIGAQAHKAMNFDFVKRPGYSVITLPYPLYHKEQHELKYYDVETSFTRLAYTYGLSAENEFDATHAQHRGNLNAVANIHGYTNTGYFTHQQSNNIQVDALIHYEIPSKIYGFRVSYIFNRFKLDENAGLNSVEDFKNQIADNLKGYNMKLYNANSLINTHDLLFQQYVNLRDKKNHYFGTITHAIQYKKIRTQYFDSSLDTNFYQNRFLISADTTNDTILCHQLINTIQWSNFSPFDKPSQKKYFFHMAAGIMYEYVDNHIPAMHFSCNPENIINEETVCFSDTLKHSQYKFRSHMLTPFARMHLRLFSVMNIYAGISYTLSGYNQYDAMADAAVSWTLSKANRHYISLSANFFRVSPDYIYSYYAGNHFYWENEWKKQNVVKLTAQWQRKECSASLSYFMLNHYVQFNDQLKPYVLDENVNLLQIHFFAPLRIKGFGANANIYVQYSDNKDLQVPIFAGKASAFYLFKLFQRKLQLQIGLDLMYNTAYYADAYSPILHQFYHQNSSKVGNFLYTDAYLNLKVQRISIFCRLGNFLAGALGYNYFTTPDYPMQKLRVSIGINWRFYD